MWMLGICRLCLWETRCEKHGISILIGHFWVHSLPTHARVPNTPYSVCQCTLSLKISQLQYVRLYDTKKSGYIPINSCDDMEFFLPLMVYNGITRHHDTHTEFSLGIVFFHYVSVWVTICGCDWPWCHALFSVLTVSLWWISMPAVAQSSLVWSVCRVFAYISWRILWCHHLWSL